jgi:hypothetical protein
MMKPKNYQMKTILVVAPIVFLFTSSVFSQTTPVRIFVTSATAEADAAQGFVDTSAKSQGILSDLTKELRGHKKLSVVTDRAAAELVLEFIDLRTAPTGKTSAAKKIWGSGIGINDGASEVTVSSTLVIGDYRKAMEGKGRKGNGKDAIENLANDVEVFAAANMAKIRAPQPKN